MPRREAVLELVAQGTDARDLRGAVLVGDAQSGGERDDAGHVLSPGAQPAFVTAAVDERDDGRVVAHNKRADTLGAPELVPGDRDQRNLRDRGTQVEPLRGLHRVGVESCLRCALADEPGDLVDRLDDPGLVVDEHHRDECGVRVDRAAQRVDVDNAVGMRGDPLDAKALPRQPIDRAEHRLVLDRGGDDPVESRVVLTRGAGRALHSEIVGLAAAAGEHDLVRPAPAHRSNRFAGLFERGFRGPRAGVRTRRVGRMIGEKRCHRGDRLGPHGRGGGVVEVGVDLVGAGRHPSRLGPPPRRSGPGKTPPPDGVVTEDRRSRD